MAGRLQCHGMNRLPLVVALAALAIGATPASAAPGVIADDVAAAIDAELPAGHPCRAGIAVTWVPGLLIAGHDAGGTAATGVCEIQLDPATWAQLEPCDRRRLVFHEVGHVAGLSDSAGIMDTRTAFRTDVPVRGCPARSLTERVSDAVLDVVPAGFGVTCIRAGRVVRCQARRGRIVRRYRGRALGSSVAVRRVA
jgi:hypothetical protein